jgi:hypothetical protein
MMSVPLMAEEVPDRHDDDRVPLFGTWPVIYGAVVVSAVVVMVLLALFSRWPF